MQINTTMSLKTSVASFQNLFLLVLNLEMWQEDSDEKSISYMVTIKSRILHWSPNKSGKWHTVRL